MMTENTLAVLSTGEPPLAGPGFKPGETHVKPETSVDGSRVAEGGGSAQDWVGKHLGPYQVLGVLGQGAMGIVLLAFDPLIEREVAIKVLAGHLANNPEALGRFL